MTEQEATKIILIMMTADGGCPYCAADLLDMFRHTFPEHAELAERMAEEDSHDQFPDLPHKCCTCKFRIGSRKCEMHRQPQRCYMNGFGNYSREDK